MNAKPRIAAAALALLGLSACAELAQVAKAALQPPHLTFESATVEALDLEGATVAFRWRVENPNGFGLDLARLGYRIDIENRRVVDGELPSGLKIPANGAAPLAFPLRVRWADVAGFAAIVSRRDEIAYRLSGTVGLRSPVGVLDVPLSHEGRLPLPKLPGFSLDGISIRSASLSEIALDVKLKVSNPNRFPVPAGSLDYALEVGGSAVARADGKALSPVAAGSSTVVAIPVRLSLLGAGMAASQIAAGNPVDVALTGNARIAGIPLPLELRTRLRPMR
ncbi:MAG TPA: LEA type 2 family protein [Anaeromyxobacteraceae bacterium]|nr:LEA type 2 family protein [Anaeromyxobacteraceae bacterium]